MKHITFSRYLAGLLVLACFEIYAAETPEVIPDNDLRQLSPESRHEAWAKKPESELQRLADAGHPAAQFVLWEKWASERKPGARALLEKAANAGLPQAMHEQGLRVAINYSTPVEVRREGWAMLQKAAEAGWGRFTVAEYDAGYVTFSGDAESPAPVVTPNLRRALAYFRELADKDYAPAKVYLSLLYSSGVGEPRNPAESPHKLLLSAAAEGNRQAMALLSHRYRLGYAGTVDLLEAARWAALRSFSPSSGASTSTESLGVEAGTSEFARLLSLFSKAFQQRKPDAALTLARIYADANKPAEALALFRFAQTVGASDTAPEIQKLESKLDPEQKARSADPQLFPYPQQR